MNATQSFKIYEILQKHFNNDADAKAVVAEIEQIIENGSGGKKNISAVKDDVYILKHDMARFELKMDEQFNNLIRWIIGTGVGIAVSILIIIKLFVVS